MEQQLGQTWGLRMAYDGSVSREFYLSRDENASVYYPGASTTIVGIKCPSAI